MKMRYGVYERGDVGRGAEHALRLTPDRLTAWSIALDYGPGYVVCVLPGPYSSVRDEVKALESSAYIEGHRLGMIAAEPLRIDMRTRFGREYRRGFEDAQIAVKMHDSRIKRGAVLL